MIRKVIAILLFLCAYAFSSEAVDTYNKAQYYEDNGDVAKAMIYYKRAYELSMPSKDGNISEDKIVKKDEDILKFGENSISGYKDEQTDNTVKEILSSAFDIEAYKTNYLLPVTYNFVSHDGRRDIETKFQISIKKSISKNLLGLNDELFFGYTQTSWWQTTAPSAPFRESNYAPEFFMVIPNADEQSALKEYKVGLLHQSNGQGGSLSRSWNRVYASGMFQTYGIFITPRVWYRFPEREKRDESDTHGDDNPDIYNYLGYGDLTISYPYKKNLFTLLLRNNLKFNSQNKGAVQFDWTFPIGGAKDLFGYIQLFSGYGESLIDYNKRNNKVAIGFAITR